MSAAALAAQPTLHGAAICGADFPEGVFRYPTAFVLGRTRSAFAYVVIARSREGVRPDPQATVFRHEGEWFAVIDYPGQMRASVLFTVDLDDCEPPPQFGKRLRVP